MKCVLSHGQLFVTPWTGLPGSSVHGISHARILDWAAIPFSRVYSWPRDQTSVSAWQTDSLTDWATREACNCYWNLIGTLVPRFLHSTLLVIFVGICDTCTFIEHFQHCVVVHCTNGSQGFIQSPAHQYAGPFLVKIFSVLSTCHSFHHLKCVTKF